MAASERTVGGAAKEPHFREEGEERMFPPGEDWDAKQRREGSVRGVGRQRR